MGNCNYLIKDMQSKYIERRIVEILELESFLIKNDYSLVEQFGHRLKGNGQSFGYEKLSELGSQIEKEAKEKNKEKIKIIFRKIKSYVQKQKTKERIS